MHSGTHTTEPSSIMFFGGALSSISLPIERAPPLRNSLHTIYLGFYLCSCILYQFSILMYRFPVIVFYLSFLLVGIAIYKIVCSGL